MTGRRKSLRRSKHDVYRVRETSGALLYVGCSVNAFLRVQQHKAEHQPWFPMAALVDITRYPDRDTARQIEAAAIANEAPAWNKAQEATALRRANGVAVVPLEHYEGIPIAEFWRC